MPGTYAGTSSCGTYPSFTRRGFLHVPSGRRLAGINMSPADKQSKMTKLKGYIIVDLFL